MRFVPNNNLHIIQNSKQGYIIVIYNSATNFFYKIPVNSALSSNAAPYDISSSISIYTCVSTLYSIILISPRSELKFLKPHTDKK